MKLCYLYFIILFLLLPIATAGDLFNLKPYNTRGISEIIYEKTTVDFDHTYNEIYVSYNSLQEPFLFRLDSNQSYNVWDVEFFVDGNHYSYDPRPDLGCAGKDEKDHYVTCFEPISFNDSGVHSIKITYFMDNVKQTTPILNIPVIGKIMIYPFDEFEVFILNDTISDDSYRIRKFIFKEVDIDTSVSEKLTEDFTIKSSINEYNLSFNIPTKTINTTNMRITAGVGIDNCNSINFDTNICYYNDSCSELLICQFPLKTEVKFFRSFFPAPFLFWLILTFLVFISVYIYFFDKKIKEITKVKNKFIHSLYEIYVKSTVFFAIAEFTVAILPPSRPLSLTLFDLLIFIPLLLITLFSISTFLFEKKDRICNYLVVLWKKIKYILEKILAFFIILLSFLKRKALFCWEFMLKGKNFMQKWVK